MSFLQSIHDGTFTIVVEFTPHSAAEVKHIAEVGKGLAELNRKYADKGVAFAGISMTQNPGGNLSYDHQAAIAILREQGFPNSLQIIPHITGKDMNVDAVAGLLISLLERGVDTILSLTGDAPTTAKGVFEIDALGLLRLVKTINVERLRKCRDTGSFAGVPLLMSGAAVSPFKYTPGSLAMQYIKAAKKIREGAAFLTCQSGWDAARSEQLAKELGNCGVPLIGNVLVVNQAAARFMQKLPGCVVTDAFVERLGNDSADDTLVRAGQQMAMFRALGYGGADLGKPGEFKKIADIEKVVDTALAITDWREFRDNLTFAPAESDAPHTRDKAPVSFAIHNAVFEEGGALHGITRKVLGPFERSAQHEGTLYKLFNAMEGTAKGLLYECEHCGDCFLPDNQYVCTRGGCAKGIANPPCGDADASGHCGSKPNRICVGERVYRRLVSRDVLEDFKQKVFPPRKAALQDSSSLLNFFFGRDHEGEPPLRKSGFIQVAEMLHASIPFPGAAMSYLQTLGEDAFEKPNRGLDAVEYLISSQAKQGADYIEINIDALGDPNAPDLMRKYVRLVHRYSDGVPPCVDSSDENVLVAGLEEWFSLGKDLAPPMCNSIPFVEMDNRSRVYAMRKVSPFRVVCLLVGPFGPMGSAEEMVNSARTMFGRARDAGFRADEVVFDCVTLGIATDGFVDGNGMTKASHTHCSFNAIKQIREDAEMKGVHAILGVSNWVYGAKNRRVGHLRAFIEVGRRYGLDAIIADVDKEFGIVPAAPELIDFVNMYVGLDGSDESVMTYMDKITEFREKNWV